MQIHQLEDKNRELEDKLDEERQKREEEKLRRERAELLIRPTTSTEYLDLCHTFFSKLLSVKTRPSMTSSGDIKLTHC
jgi:hypothetical protein